MSELLPESLKAPLRPAMRRYRRATRRLRFLPSFMIIGAQRSGTTTLAYYLGRHPDLRSPSGGDGSVGWPKELHFFDERFALGLDWYRTYFPLRAERFLRRALSRDLIACEGTPYYLFHPAVPERVAAVLPDMRLIALLRNPVDRARSHYDLMRRMGRERLSFEQALAVEDDRLARERESLHDPGFRARHHRYHAYVGRGLYAEQLERWLAHFPSEQLLVLRAEDFRARPDEVYAQVLAFIRARNWRPAHFEPKNRTPSCSQLDPWLRAWLETRFAEPNARLARLLGHDFGWTSQVREDGRQGSACSPQLSSALRPKA